MACLNIIHVKYDSCRAQRKRVILILNISDFREQYLVTKDYLLFHLGLILRMKMEQILSLLSFQPPTKLATYLRVLHKPLHCFHLALQHTFNLSPLLFWNKQSWNSLKISYCAFEINSLR